MGVGAGGLPRSARVELSVTATLCCSHKVNVKLQSGAAAFFFPTASEPDKLKCSLAVEPHAGARAHARGGDTCARASERSHTRARTHGKTHTHTLDFTPNTDKVKRRRLHAAEKGKVEGAAHSFTLSVSSWGLSSPYILLSLRIY